MVGVGWQMAARRFSRPGWQPQHNLAERVECQLMELWSRMNAKLSGRNGTQFEDEGSGHLAIVLQGEFAISPRQIKVLKNQLRERMPAR